MSKGNNHSEGELHRDFSIRGAYGDYVAAVMGGTHF